MKILLPALIVLSLVFAGCSDVYDTETPSDTSLTVPADPGSDVVEMLVEETESVDERVEVREQVVSVSAFEFDYSLSSNTFDAEQAIVFNFNNDGTIRHNLVIEETGDSTSLLNAGEFESLTVTLEPGTYTYFCSVPGHRQRGMEGTFTIE